MKVSLGQGDMPMLSFTLERSWELMNKCYNFLLTMLKRIRDLPTAFVSRFDTI